MYRRANQAPHPRLMQKAVPAHSPVLHGTEAAVAASSELARPGDQSARGFAKLGLRRRSPAAEQRAKGPEERAGTTAPPRTRRCRTGGGPAERAARPQGPSSARPASHPGPRCLGHSGVDMCRLPCALQLLVGNLHKTSAPAAATDDRHPTGFDQQACVAPVLHLRCVAVVTYLYAVQQSYRHDPCNGLLSSGVLQQGQKETLKGLGPALIFSRGRADAIRPLQREDPCCAHPLRAWAGGCRLCGGEECDGAPALGRR